MMLKRNVLWSLREWREHPMRMVARAIVSLLVGQGIFWKFGYDQLGIGMDPKVQLGTGVKLADRAANWLPETARVAWTLKAIEIVADAGKMPLEGKAFARHGIVPDVVAFLVTQPLWSLIEALEKLVGAVRHPERVTTPEQIRLSIACIFGNCFRYVLAGFVIVTGGLLNRWLTDPIERLLTKSLRRPEV